MARELIVNSVAFSFPDQGENPNWGREITEWATEVSDVLETIFGPNDITNTEFSLTNDQSIAANVTGLVFSPSSVRAAKISADAYITTSSEELHEYFEIVVGYEGGAWDISVTSYFDDSGIVFSIDGGQVKYTSTAVAGTGYVGALQFKATTISQ